MARIFLSYGRGDDPDPHPFMQKLYNDLTAAGHSVWFDKRSMPSGGATFNQEIRDAVAAHDRLMLCVGPYALQSAYVRAEWDYARSICKPITPLLRMHDYQAIPSELQNYHAVDFYAERRSYDESIAELLRVLEEPVAPLGALHNVPPLPQWYVRRHDDIAAIVAVVCADILKPVVVSGQRQLIGLEGAGGIGKTTLAKAVCHECEVRRAFPDGIFFVELGQSPDKDHLLDLTKRLGDIGVAFGDDRREYPDEQRARSRLTALLADKAVLLVLDDVWDHQHVQAFQIVGSRGRVMITTRNGRLLTTLGAISQLVDTLTAAEGRDLIAQRLNVAPARLSDDYTAVIKRLGGHTLAIELAAAWLYERGADRAADLLRRLEKRHATDNPFKDLILAETDKNTNLELCLSLSYDDLSPDLQRRFRALGIFAPDGAANRAAIGAVWGDDDPDDTDDAINTLVRANLLEEVPLDAQTEPRYSQHGLLRAYALALVQREREAETARARHLDHYFLQYGDEKHNYDEDRHGTIRLDMPDIHAALRWGYHHRPDQAVTLVVALNYYMYLHEPIVIRHELLSGGLAAAQKAGDLHGQAKTLEQLGDLARAGKDYTTAVAHYQQAVAGYQVVNDQVGLGFTHRALGDVARQQGADQQALDHYQVALIHFEATGDQRGAAYIQQALGDLALMQSQFVSAQHAFEQALATYEAVGFRMGIARTHKGLGDAAVGLSDPRTAREHYQAALDTARAIHDRLGTANILYAMADLAFQSDDWATARRSYSQARGLYKSVGNAQGLFYTLTRLGQLYEHQQQPQSACEHIQQALDLAMQHPFLADNPMLATTQAIAARLGCG